MITRPHLQVLLKHHQLWRKTMLQLLGHEKPTKEEDDSNEVTKLDDGKLDDSNKI